MIYQVFGLRLESDLALPELREAEGSAPPDVRIVIKGLSRRDAIAGLQPDPDGLLFTVPQVAQYLIRNGREIAVDPHPGVPDRNVRLYLLGSVFGILLHQRGLLPLHANAIEIEGRAIAFVGESGAGKSTLAAWFHDQGYKVVADDVCVLRFNNRLALVSPGIPRLRMWQDALHVTGRSPASLERSYVGEAEPYDKFDLPVSSEAATTVEHLPLSAVCLLRRGKELSSSRLTGVDAARAIFENTYRGAFLGLTGGREMHWESVVKLVRLVPVYTMSRPWDLTRLNEVNPTILAEALNWSRQPCA